MKKLFQEKNYKKYFYFICFFILCVCDQRIGSASGEIQLVCPNIVLMVLSGLALSHYPRSSFHRFSFRIPAMICTAGACLALFLMWPNVHYHYQLLSGALAGILYGFVLIQTVRAVVSEKRIPGASHLGVGLLGLLLVLILLSRHDQYNGLLLCLSVVLIYLTDFEPQEYRWMFRALCCALLAAFFVFQGLAFVFRPYDVLRYLGLYANTNINALFYQMVYCVFFGIFCILETKKSHCFLKWGSFCFACAMWSFVLLTMCRSALLGMSAATFLGYGIVLWKRRGAWVRRGLLCACGLLFGIVFSFPVVFVAVRYLPALFHHPIWFEGEYYEWKVHSFDVWDSPKYVGWQDVIQGNFSRLFPSTVGMDVSLEPDVKMPFMPAGERKRKMIAPEVVSVALLASSEAETFPVEGTTSEAEQEGTSEATGSTNVRIVIYRYYLSQLNLWGHMDSENGAQVNAAYCAPHAHNVVLQYAFNYGLPAGIVFLVYLVASGIRFLLFCARDESGMSFLPGLLLFTAIVVFGMTEMVWRYGQLSHTLLLLMPCFAWQYRGADPDKAM